MINILFVVVLVVLSVFLVSGCISDVVETGDNIINATANNTCTQLCEVCDCCGVTNE